jgi:hypothetical protein
MPHGNIQKNHTRTKPFHLLQRIFGGRCLKNLKTRTLPQPFRKKRSAKIKVINQQNPTPAILSLHKNPSSFTRFARMNSKNVRRILKGKKV